MSLSTLVSELFTQKRSILRLFDMNNANEPVAELEMDVVLSENVAFSKTVTKFPIESGEEATDNSFINPITVTLDCIVSESPISYSDYGARFDAFKNDILGEDSTQENVYVAAAKEFMAVALQHNIVAEIEIGLGLYESLVITNVSYNKTAENTGVLAFTIELEEIILVKSEITDLPETGGYSPKGGDAQKTRGSGKSNKGTTKPDVASDAAVKAANKTQTPFARLVEALADLFSGGV